MGHHDQLKELVHHEDDASIILELILVETLTE